MRKGLAVGIILLFVGTCIIPAIAQDTEKPLPTSRGNWLYVGGSGPGNYSKIQDAINTSIDGDTIYVYNDSSPYYEHLTITTSIHLIGEDRKTTVIDGNGTGYVVVVDADNTTIQSLTIQGSGSSHVGICHIYDIENDSSLLENLTISNCIVTKNIVGIYLECVTGCMISDSLIQHNVNSGVIIVKQVETVNENSIVRNDIWHNCVGIWIQPYSSSGPDSHSILISDNRINGSSLVGIWLSSTNSNTICRNVIRWNLYGLYIDAGIGSTGNTVYQNTFEHNDYGIKLTRGRRQDGPLKATFYLNNFINNRLDVRNEGNNQWSNGSVGNYWDQWIGLKGGIFTWFPKVISRYDPETVIELEPLHIAFDWHPLKEPYNIPRTRLEKEI
jgi:nitrous oxidase accessory protein